MNASKLKQKHLEHNPDSHFFDRETMKYFGDTMRNYYVPSRPVTVRTRNGDHLECYELVRRKPVKHNLSSSTFFSCNDFVRVFPSTIIDKD